MGFEILIGAGIFAALYCWRLVSKNLVKVEQGYAMVITNAFKKEPRVTFTGGVVWPMAEKAELMDISVKTIDIDRRGKEGLICRDNIRADIRVSFYVKVNREDSDVIQVAQAVGCQRASDIKTLEDLYASKFSEALKTVGKQMDFEELYTKREQFRDEIIKVIGKDLSGYYLEDAAIDYLEQTPLEALDPENIMDADGIRKITEKTSEQHVKTNEFRQSARKAVEKENKEADAIVRALERQDEDDKAEQQRMILQKRAEEEALTREAQAESMARAEEARIKAQEKIDIENVNREREVEVARKNQERIIAIENERVERDRSLEAIQRERETEVRRYEKERELEEERKRIQDIIAERISVEKNVAAEEEKIKELRLLEEARRTKEARVIQAEADAEEEVIRQVKQAEAEETVARSKAKARLTQVDAELEAADREAQAKIRLAEGVQAERAAEGLAEARVKEAMATAFEKEGMAKVRVMEAQAPAEEKVGMAKINVKKAEYETNADGIRQKMVAEAEGTKQNLTAEAEGTRAKMSAEAEGIAKKAESMKLLDEVSRDHEEFRLRLENDRLIAFENFKVQKDVAHAQAAVVGEAFKSANIDIVGGDGVFIDKIFQAASLGKSFDAFGHNGKAAGALVGDYANGNRSLAGDIKDVLSNVRSEDLRNLTLAKLLNNMANEGSAAEKVKLKKVIDAVANMGLAELPVSKD